jgi:hypothetical protein
VFWSNYFTHWNEWIHYWNTQCDNNTIVYEGKIIWPVQRYSYSNPVLVVLFYPLNELIHALLEHTMTQLYTKEKLSDLYKDIPIAILFWSYYFTHWNELIHALLEHTMTQLYTKEKLLWKRKWMYMTMISLYKTVLLFIFLFAIKLLYSEFTASH